MLSWTAYAWSTIYWTIVVVGVCLNLVILAVSFRLRRTPDRRQFVTNLFLCSMAVANLGTLLSNIWVQAVTYVQPAFVYGRVWCKTQSILRVMCSEGSMWFLAAVGVDRSVN